MSKSYCPIPWLFQAIRNNGDIRVCCQANVSKNKGILRDNEGRAYNARDGKLVEARNSRLIKHMRKEMLDGQWPEECVRCKTEEENGLNSRRQYELTNWNLSLNEAREKTEEDGAIDIKKSPVLYYDLRFGNKCNLACVMCGPGDSDSWYSDYTELTGLTSYYDSHGKVDLVKNNNKWRDSKKTYNWYESDLFWNELEANMESTQHIYMAGGEPLLIKPHYDFLEKCIDLKVSNNIILEYNTNVTVLPQRVIDLWENFKQVRIGASIDGYGEVLEYQRYPAQWDSIYKNLQKIDELPKHVFSWLAYTVTVYNVMHLPEFIRWKIMESGFKRINSSAKKPVITYHMAHKPDHLNIRVFSDEEKQKVVNHFKESKVKFESLFEVTIYEKACEILDSVESYMLSGSNYDEFYKTFVDYTSKLDRIRGNSSAKFLP